uniref:Uncharacterized protein n=1 Tax=Arundo donax TaxID=35708 RepID=A0A0A8XT89_ARUDO
MARHTRSHASSCNICMNIRQTWFKNSNPSWMLHLTN